MLSMTLDPVAPKISGPAVADAVTGLYAAQGILAALVRRGIDGKGHVVEISMLEAMSHFLIEPYASYFRSEQEPGAYGRAASSQSFALVCSDGAVVALHLSSPQKFWLSALEVAGLEQLARDPRFEVRVDRITNHEQLRLEFQAAFEKHPRDHWLRKLVAADVPHAPVLKIADALQDPQFEHLRIAVEAFHPTEGLVRTIRPPYRFDGRIETEVLAPPTLGEHNAEIRAELDAGRTA
jgi:crotonobetainyl-CoA:carnitine CoA-transferase CaiB-like acyl-CoA transferase